MDDKKESTNVVSVLDRDHSSEREKDYPLDDKRSTVRPALARSARDSLFQR